MTSKDAPTNRFVLRDEKKICAELIIFLKILGISTKIITHIC
jgi:hypothetical protein